MCEFKVVLNEKVVFEDVIYAKAYEDKVLAKNILGESKEFENCRIAEIDVNSTRLVLSSTKGSS